MQEKLSAGVGPFLHDLQAAFGRAGAAFGMLVRQGFLMPDRPDSEKFQHASPESPARKPSRMTSWRSAHRSRNHDSAHAEDGTAHEVRVLDHPARNRQRPDTVAYREIERVRGDRSHLPPKQLSPMDVELILSLRYLHLHPGARDHLRGPLGDCHAQWCNGERTGAQDGSD